VALRRLFLTNNLFVPPFPFFRYVTAIWDCQGQGYSNLDPSLVTSQDGIIATMKVRIGGL